MRLRSLVAGAILALCLLAPAPAHSQAIVIESCGTLPATLPSGSTGRALYIDVNGQLCSASPGLATGAATSANQVLIIDALNSLIAQGITSCTAAPVVSAAAEDSHVLKGSAGTLCGVYATNLTATPGFLMLFDSATEPADGAVTPLVCIPLPANGVANVAFGTGFGSSYAVGITASISSTGCFTKTTTGMTAFFAGQVL